MVILTEVTITHIIKVFRLVLEGITDMIMVVMMMLVAKDILINKIFQQVGHQMFHNLLPDLILTLIPDLMPSILLELILKLLPEPTLNLLLGLPPK